MVVTPKDSKTSDASGETPRWGFWFFGITFVFFMLASSAPSPLYVVYQQKFGFSAAVLTLVFAVYVVALLIALLTVGSLSDFVGRRPMLLASFVAEALALATFAFAQNLTWLLVARAVQGAATGAATGVIGAGAIDNQRRDRPGSAATLNAVAPGVGLAAGAVAAGVFVQYLPQPTRLIYLVLIGAFVVLFFIALRLPETSPRITGAVASLVPQLKFPRYLRPYLVRAAPCLFCSWSLGGFYLALGPSITKSVLGLDNHLIGGLTICALALPSTSVLLFRRFFDNHGLMYIGAGATAIGVIGVMLSTLAGATILFFLASIVAGVGFGTIFVGSFGSVSERINPLERAQIVATIYVINYTAFSVPVIVAGLVVAQQGMLRTTTYFSIYVFVLAILAFVAIRSGRRRARELPAP
ncbi:putative MFS family arabinose efflux permease [Antricoccus suffuscus]|uniref:Putative MFS family arabinose efflux permease n=1 Tax=Antricoccus suffuscus TaxID=1629062 RepID=A0A2T0Z020_9ACTN|nr:MFS transporter [Antricoccus suffuscus]PRZ29695.1 putative MFS family arabinose efflux permease [Antricoccus suffuscus]